MGRDGKYRENFSRIGEFAATGALRVAGGMRVLPMTQHASWQITFGMKENNSACFMADNVWTDGK
jgi:hypothetical protein